MAKITFDPPLPLATGPRAEFDLPDQIKTRHLRGIPFSKFERGEMEADDMARLASNVLAIPVGDVLDLDLGDFARLMGRLGPLFASSAPAPSPTTGKTAPGSSSFTPGSAPARSSP